MIEAKYQPLARDDFIVIQTKRYEWPTGYIAEFRIGRVSSVDDTGLVQTYRDTIGLSRMVGKESVVQTWGVPARYLESVEWFWQSVIDGPECFDSYEDVRQFILGYVCHGAVTE